MMMSQSSSM